MPRILLIGNKQSNYETLSQQLYPHGYDLLLSTEGGDQGIIVAIRESPDLILVESALAIINGWQVIKILKTSTITQETPIIALMSPANQIDWQMVLRSDCDDYCLKPVSLMGLLGKLEHILGSNGTSAKPAKNQNAPLSQNLVFQKRRQPPGSSKLSSNKSQQTPPIKSAPTQPLVIYIEDYQADSLAMAKIVQNAGYNYANIVHPLDALPQLLELKPQLIFLDLVMPLVNGYELCAQIRRMTVFKEIPIIIVTNNDGIVDRVRAKVVGASGFLGKPIKQKRVEKVLTKYLQPTPEVLSDSSNQADLLPLF